MDYSDLHVLKESPTLNINRVSKEREKRGLPVYKFGFGESPFDPPKDVISSLKEHADKTYYAKVEGDEELREKISKFHYDACGIQSSADQVIVGPGSKILIYLIMLSIKDADVLVASPSWVSYRPQIDLCGHNLINIETSLDDRWRITPENLIKAFSQKLRKNTICIVNYPGNPDGLSYTNKEIEELIPIFKSTNCLVISDEIYALLHFANEHSSFQKYYPENTVVTTGLSKWCGAGGWRFGTAIFPEEKHVLQQAVLGLSSETFSCVSSPILKAASAAYHDYAEVKPYLDLQKHILEKIAKYCANTLNEHGIITIHSVGGFYLFPDFSNYREALNRRNIYTSTELCSRLLYDTGVALLPGTAFGMQEDQLLARLAYVDFKMDRHSDSDFKMNIHAIKLTKGIDQLIQWLSNFS